MPYPSLSPGNPLEELLRQKFGQMPFGSAMPSHSPPMEEMNLMPSHEREPQYFSPAAEEITAERPAANLGAEPPWTPEQPARNEEDLRIHQRNRNDISTAAALAPAPSLAPSGNAASSQEGTPPATAEREEQIDPNTLDFSRINELSNSYQQHLGELPENEGQGIGRKLLSILLGYGASLGGGGLAHGYSVGKQFYDQPHQEKVADWGMRGEGLETSMDTELERLGEESNFLNESQDNELDFMKFLGTRGDADREFAAERGDAGIDQDLARDEFNFGQTESNRGQALDESEAADRAEYWQRMTDNYGERTNQMGKTEKGISLEDEQNTIREIMIQYPELVDAFVKDQDGDFFIPKVNAPEGGWIFGPSDEEEFGYERNSQLAERARRLLQEKLQGSGGEVEGEATEEIDFEQLVEMIRGGAI